MIVGDVLRFATIYAGYAIVSYVIFLITYRLLLHPLSQYPGPLLAKLTQGYSGFIAVQKRLHLEIYQYHQRYGPVVRIGPNRLVFNTVTALRDIYQNDRITRARCYVFNPKDKVFNVLNAIDKNIHRSKRQLVGQAVADRSIRQFEPTMMVQIDTCLRQILESSKDSTAVDITEKSRHLGLDIVGHLAFGYDLRVQTEEENRFIMKALTFGNFRSNIYLQLPILTKLYVNKIFDYIFYEAREKYYRLLETMIRTRLAQEKQAKRDLYYFIADSVEADPESLRGGDLWMEALFFLVAGGDTTASAICSTFFYLSRNRSCYEKLTSEIRSTFTSGADIKGGPQLASCHYLRACIDESMRMSPPVTSILWREQDTNDKSNDPIIVDGHVIPRGTYVGVNAYAIHHNEDYFPDSFTFQPERWLSTSPGLDSPENRAAKKLMQDAFAPFSIGYRGCAGKTMAYLEISLIVAKALWYFDFHAAPGKLGEVGAGQKGKANGRERPNEYQLYDIFASRHDGPFLVFSRRGEHWKELEVPAQT
ncbi:cytochrome P450 [Jackrogersella minutella]|nr:cytochrome P450 [Jackrogersella minutella]